MNMMFHHVWLKVPRLPLWFAPNQVAGAPMERTKSKNSCRVTLLGAGREEALKKIYVKKNERKIGGFHK